MIQAQLQDAVREWRQNRRLRLGTLAIVAIVAVQLVWWRADARAALVEDYRRAAELLARLESASRESAWIDRAAASEAALEAERASIPTVDSDGLAQAEMQAWLTDLAALSGVPDAVVRVENAVAVEGHPDMWQVLGRLDGGIPADGIPILVRTVSAAGPWFQAERLELQDGSVPRLSLVLRGYFRQGEAPANAGRPAGLPADVPAPDPGARLANRPNPLAPPAAASTEPARPTGAAGTSDRTESSSPARSGSNAGRPRRFPPGYRSDDSDVPERPAAEPRQPAPLRTDAPRATVAPTTTRDASGTGSVRRSPPAGPAGGGGRPPGWGGGAP